MKIFIFHHHLNPGGVTRIIESQIESVRNAKLTVITASCQKPENIRKARADIIIKENLNYLEKKAHGFDHSISLFRTGKTCIKEYRKYIERHSLPE